MDSEIHSNITYFTGKCIHEIFEFQVRTNPDAIALQFEDRQLTYSQLNARANRLARHLLEQGIEPEQLIAIMMERSVEMFIAILGIIKSGAAYVPIDPSGPQNRIAFILKDTQAPVLITRQHLENQVPAEFTGTSLLLDDIEESAPVNDTNLKLDLSPDNLIYTIYTSGSTGKPKGVLVEHRNVVNLVAGQMKFVNEPVKRFLFAYSFAFDGSVLLMWWTLLQGATLVIAPEGLEKNISAFADYIGQHGISHLLTFPSLYQLLLDNVESRQLKSLESVSVAGEACPGNLIKQHHKKLPKTRLLNQYGPTEATVGATIFITSEGIDTPKTPIGTCIENVEIYILDPQLQPMADGETGELFIAGRGVARGYLNRPRLTKERFLKDPFSKDPQARMYKTGDLGKRLPDGNLDFIGRTDFQIKLRGYRIELGEIEAILNEHYAVRESVVRLFGEKPEDQKLVAFLVLKNTADTNTAEIRSFLETQLPEYMIPAEFVYLEKMPLNAVGKVDRKALFAPSGERPSLETAYIAPHSDLQKHLTASWSRILNIKNIGIKDKFFELGGNSLQAARFIAEIQKDIGENIFIVSLFNHPTIERFAHMLEKEYAQEVKKRFISSDPSPEATKETRKLNEKDFEHFHRLIPKHLSPGKKNRKNKPAIFILAPPRSGTSLLRVMLAGHPDLFTTSELQLLGFDTLSDRTGAYQGKYSLWKEGLIRVVMELNDADADKAKAFISEKEQAGWTTSQFYTYLQKQVGEKVLVEKSPSYALDPMTLQKAESSFENPLYIHLARHPYAMVRSFEKMHMDQVLYLEDHPYTGRQLGELIWAESHKNILGFLSSIPASRQCRILYEDLVKAPERTMKALCSHLGLDYYPGLIKPYENIDTKMTDGIYADSKPMGDVNLLQHRKILASKADEWKNAGNDHALHKTSQQLAERLGYQIFKQKTKPEKKATQDIAIIGLSIRVPGANNPGEFWQNLVKEVDVSREFTEAELLAAGIDPQLFNNPDYTKRGMSLEDFDCFDASFFGYHPKEAALMDPQHRLFLEGAWSALEDAGYDPERFTGSIGVFGGVARNTYLVNNVITHPEYFELLDDFQRGITLEKDFPATRVAYKLNLTGPAVNVQTACSSSGVAVHLACQSILNGDSDMTIVGGGRIQPPVHSGHLHKEGHALSPDGYCRAFDADANGMVRGQGMVFIVLKKLDRAIDDGDSIRAVIKATAINNDGSDKIGFTAPSISGQSAAISKAYRKAGIHPETVSYIEAHGTGTSIGDPIEIAGLTKAFSDFTEKKQFCAIGSVKTNIGHLDAGACVAGIIKTVLALEHCQLPKNLHFKRPNPQIEFQKTPFFVNDRLRPWEKGKQPRRAGISSFGLGGTNAHIIIEEAPEYDRATPEKPHQLLLLSAKQESALERASAQLGRFLENHPEINLGNVAYTLQKGRVQCKKRQFILASHSGDAAQVLGKNNPKKFSGTADRPAENIIFMFPGGGAQHTNMGYQLYEQEPVFRKAVDECLDLLKTEHQLDLYNVLYPEQRQGLNKPIHDPLHGITLLFAIEYATAKLWQSWGVVATQMIGHSLGEYTAACIAGVFSLKDALGIVAKRGELFLTLEKGSMLSVPLPEEQLKPMLNGHLSFAAINKPDSCVLSGSDEAIESIQEKFEAQEIHTSRLHISVAAHSYMIEPILEAFGAYLKTITFHKPKVPIISNLTGNFVDPETIQTPEYWLKHLRQTVRFNAGIETLLRLENNIFLEIGPGQMLSTFARQHPARRKDQLILASLRHPKETTSDLAFILKSLGHLWLTGIDIDWNAFHQDRKFQHISLPTYAFERKRHWIAPKKLSITKTQDKTGIMNEPKAEQKINTPEFTIDRKTLILRDLKEIFHQLSGIAIKELNDQATFLEMGFDSLFLTQVVGKIKKKLDIKLNFRQLFEEAPTLNDLAGFVNKKLPVSTYQDELNRLISSKQSSHQQLIHPSPKSISQSTHESLRTPLPPPPDFLPSGNASNLEVIIQQQLQLMQQQLDLLKGEVASGSHTRIVSDSSTGPAAKEPETLNTDPAPPADYKSEAHGPWKPIPQKTDSGLSNRQQQYLEDLIERYTKKTKGSQQLTQHQRKHLADPRSITGFNRLWKDMIYQIAVEKSKGSKVWDVDGNEYIDYRMAFGISLFGHTPDFVQQAVAGQLEKGFELGVLTPLASKVAHLLCELSGMDRATLVNTGSEAISAAVRAARTVTMKDKIVVFEGDYHGIADEMLVRAVKQGNKTKALPVAPGIPNLAVQNVIILDYDDPDVLRKIELHADEIAAVLIEPIQPNYPVRQPKALLHGIRKLTRQNDIALIFDEMITGFRIALRGAQEWYDIEADIVAYGKIISGGLPMAAVAGKSRFMDVFDGGQWRFGDQSYPEVGVTFFGGTFVKHPLSLAAAYAALSEIKKQGIQLYTDLNEKSARFANSLQALFTETKVPMKVLSTASIVSIRFTDSNPLSKLIFFYLRLKGIHIKEKAALISTEHSEADLEKTYRAFEESIREMQTAGFFKLSVMESEDQSQIVLPPVHKIGNQPISRITGLQNVPLTDGQKEVWAEQQLGDEAAAAYNLAGDLRLKGALDIKALQKAIDQLILRHEALRTVFNKSEPTQRILPGFRIELPVVDLSHFEKKEKTEKLRELRSAETGTALDLFNGPLIRFTLVKLDETEHHLFMTAHHGIADGWSCGLLIRDLGQLYSEACGKHAANLPEAKQLSSYALEQEVFKTTEEFARAEQYWSGKFETSVPVLEFPTDRPRPPVKTYRADFHRIRIGKSLAERLKSTASKNGATLFASLYSAFQAFVYRLSHQGDFVLGMVASAQTIAGNENLVAHGVSLLPIRAKVDGHSTFTEHLKNTRKAILDAFDHRNYTLGTLVRKLKLPRDPSRQPIISILFNMDSDFGHLEYGDLEAGLSPIPRKYETFDIFFNVKAGATGIDLEWTYNTDLFDKTTIRRRLSEFEVFLSNIADDPKQMIDRLEILPEEEKHQILRAWNDTDTPFPDRICIHERFEQQVLKTPDKIAVESQDSALTYRELNESANQIGHYLLEKGVQTGDFVAIYLERSVDLLAGLLAILKAGGIYVPLDPGNPKDRIKVIIEDAEARFLITNESMADQLPEFEGEVICLKKDASPIQKCSKTDPKAPVRSSDLAYVIYTSGSTGKPKGVIIPHYAVIDHHLAMIKAIGVVETEVILSVASVSFDPSVQDFFMPLFIGAKVVIASQEEVVDGFLLKERLEKSKITLMQATPATWHMLISAGWKGNENITVKSVGEGLTAELADQLLARSKTVFNAYGPSETTIYTTTKKITPDRESKARAGGYEPVGRPLDNVKVYILDALKQPVPIGVAGEVYVGGVGVAPGAYFKRAQLSAEKFVNNPFDPESGKKLYRTGDLAKYHSNGDIEFLGRADHQVKIRGFRIEPGEVESQVSKFPGIERVVVLVREDDPGDKRLVAYLTTRGESKPDLSGLKQHLKHQLPEYMVPSAFVELEAFPLTATLKVDRKQLPAPDYGLHEQTSVYQAARNETEQVLAGIWKKLLKIEKIGVFDNFFELGGHSLIATKMFAEIQKQSGKLLPLATLLEYPTISQLASVITDDRKAEEVQSRSLVPIKPTGSKTPVYLVHGAGLHVLMFQTLAANMDEDQPIFALQAHGLNGESEPFEKMEAIAGHYIQEILKQNPDGPYALAGYSFGGLIAFEMTKQLEAMGREVTMLAMFDTIVHQSITGSKENWNYYKKLMNLGKKVAWNISLLAKDPIPNLKYKSHVLKRRYLRWVASGQKDVGGEIQRVDAVYGGKVDQANKKAFENYTITPYDGVIHLFKAKNQRFYLDDFEYLGWKPFAKAGIIIHDVPGDHLTLFDPPHGAQFAKVLQESLDSLTLKNINHE